LRIRRSTLNPQRHIPVRIIGESIAGRERRDRVLVIGVGVGVGGVGPALWCIG